MHCAGAIWGARSPAAHRRAAPERDIHNRRRHAAGGHEHQHRRRCDGACSGRQSAHRCAGVLLKQAVLAILHAGRGCRIVSADCRARHLHASEQENSHEEKFGRQDRWSMPVRCAGHTSMRVHAPARVWDCQRIKWGPAQECCVCTHACAVEGAEALDARVSRGEAAAERNIDEAAAQVEGAIGAASERLQGVMEDAPRQTAAVVQSAGF